MIEARRRAAIHTHRAAPRLALDAKVVEIGRCAARVVEHEDRARYTRRRAWALSKTCEDPSKASHPLLRIITPRMVQARHPCCLGLQICRSNAITSHATHGMLRLGQHTMGALSVRVCAAIAIRAAILIELQPLLF